MSEVGTAEVPEETALYHVYGEADLLLYIGISKDFGRRWREHAKKQPWWDEKRRLTVDEWFGFRSEAEAAETSAIKAERPKYNKKHAARAPNSGYLIEPGVPAPADLTGWLTVTEAAEKCGYSDQAIYHAHRQGLVEGQRFWRTPLLVNEKDLDAWAESRRQPRQRKALPFGMSDRQAEFLLDIHLRRENLAYGAAVVTRRALRKRGLITHGDALTADGVRAVRELQQQGTAAVAA